MSYDFRCFCGVGLVDVMLLLLLRSLRKDSPRDPAPSSSLRQFRISKILLF